MSEGTVTAIIRCSNKKQIDRIQGFIDKHTDGTKRSKKGGMTVISGTFFGDIVSQVDEFSQLLVSYQIDLDLVRFTLVDESGTEIFWILNEEGVDKYRHDEEHDEKSILEAYESFHTGMGSAHFGMFSKKDIAAIKKEVLGPRTKITVRLVIDPFISYDPSKGEPLEGYRLADSSSEQDGLRYAYWMPLSNDQYRKLHPLFEHLLENGAEKITAVVSPGRQVYPYKVFWVDSDGPQIIFDTDNYSQDEIIYLDGNEDEAIGDFRWYPAEPTECHRWVGSLDLESYANERLEEFRGKANNESREIEKIRAANPGKINKLVKDLEIYLSYKDMDIEIVNDISKQMIIAGMSQGEIDRDLGKGEPNIIEVSDELLGAAEWLIDNIDGLHKHKIKKSYTQSVIAINLC